MKHQKGDAVGMGTVMTGVRVNGVTGPVLEAILSKMTGGEVASGTGRAVIMVSCHPL